MGRRAFVTGSKNEKKTFSVFDVFLVLLLALAVSLVVYLFLESPYGARASADPVYELTMEKKLENWEKDFLPEDRQKLVGQKIYDESRKPAGRIIELVYTGSNEILKLRCRWDGDLKDGKTFRLETFDFVIKDMRITRIMTAEGKA